MTAKSRPSQASAKPGGPLIIGLTGGIGSGKTTVSRLFEKLGAAVIDTDIIARQLVDSDSSVLNAIIDTFGNTILTDSGTLDRKKLAQIVFSQKKQRLQLESILHPRIRSEINNQIQAFSLNVSPPAYVIIVIPLLFESGLDEIVHRVLVVISDEKTRIERVRQRDNRDIGEIRSIINTQVSDEKRTSRADDIIKNNGDIKDLELKVRQLHDQYLAFSTATEEKS